MIRLGVFMLVICALGVQSQMLHELLTPEEKLNLFQTESVPEYEVVPVTHGVKKRSLKNFFSVVFLKVFGSDLHLYLEPTEGTLAGNGTKVWTAVPDESAPNGIKYDLISEAVNSNVKTYHDLLNMAAVTTDNDDSGNLLMDGTIGSNLVMRPVPDRVQHLFSQVNRQKRESPLDKLKHLADNLKNTIPHVIFKKPDVTGAKGVFEPHIDLKNFLKRRISRFLPPKGGVVYPEMIIFMDHTLLSTFGNDLEAAKRYIISYWNGVDLRYRLLGDPSVRLNIAGIILSTGENEVPFIVNNIVEKDMIDSDQTLIDIGQHLYNEKTFVHGRDYDLFITMTKLDMCTYDDTPTCNNELMGYAYTSSACLINETTQMVEAVGMVEDNGGFKGIVPTAHEVGHLLGASHDISSDKEVKCSLTDGYIMAGGFIMTENGFEWSSCSQEVLTDYLNGPNSSCLRNKPSVHTPYPRILPGVYYTLEEQCQRVHEKSYPCNTDASVCIQLKCLDPETNFCPSAAPAAEGSPCGEGLICINGNCISKKSTVVPKSQNETLLDQYGKKIKDFIPTLASKLPKLPFFS